MTYNRQPQADERQNYAQGFEPKVSIGMPVYNGEGTIEQAINSIINQTYENFELIISDNASTDATEKICIQFSLQDSRISYYRQATNIGAAPNFQFVLNKAKGDYFAWAACDDIRSPNFIKENVKFLEKHRDFVASISPVRFKNDNFDEYRMGESSLVGDIPERVIIFFNTWHANSRFYSLIRKDPLKQCSELGKFYLGSDWATTIFLSTKGKLNKINTGYIILGKNGISNSKKIFKISRSQPIEYIFPFWRLGIYTINLANKHNFSLKYKIKIFFLLIKFNLQANITRIKFKF